jgi:hypothetical protein
LAQAQHKLVLACKQELEQEQQLELGSQLQLAHHG